MKAFEVVSAAEGYRLWAETWDTDPSAVVALESRHLRPRLGDLQGKRVLDVACGTGRWLSWARAEGASAAGLDFCREMLIQASRRPELHGTLTEADGLRLPVRDGWADVVLCTLALAHIGPVETVMPELARVVRPGGKLIVTDFHPDALRHGWKRTFRRGPTVYQIDTRPYGVAELLQSARDAGLKLRELLEARFDEPERQIFIDAGRPDAFESARRIPAVLIAEWRTGR